MGLTDEEVARRAGVSRARVRELVEAGVLAEGPDSEEPFRSGDALRIQLVDELEASGIPPERVGAAIAGGALSLSYLDRFPAPPPRSEKTHAELAEEVGVPFALVQRVYAGFGLPRPREDERVREEEVGIVAGIPLLLEAGLGEGEVLRAARVWGEGVRRVAQHQVHSFHELIEEPFRRHGLSDAEALDAALTQVGVRLIPYIHQLVAWLYARHFESHATEHRMAHVETALEEAGLQRRSAPCPEASAFADLSGYTRMIEELGDEAASQTALRLAELMQEVAEQHEGLVVKMLGDGVHFHFADPAAAVLASLDFVDRTEPLGLPPAHIGVNAGPMTYTDGDWYGLSVIIAARLAASAGPGEVLVGEAVARQGGSGDVRFETVGALRLKGVARPVRAYRAIRAV